MAGGKQTRRTGPEPIPLTLLCLELLFGEKESYLPTKAFQKEKKKEQAVPLKDTEGWDSNFSCLDVEKL